MSSAVDRLNGPCFAVLYIVPFLLLFIMGALLEWGLLASRCKMIRCCGHGREDKGWPRGGAIIARMLFASIRLCISDIIRVSFLCWVMKLAVLVSVMKDDCCRWHLCEGAMTWAGKPEHERARQM